AAWRAASRIGPRRLAGRTQFVDNGHDHGHNRDEQDAEIDRHEPRQPAPHALHRRVERLVVVVFGRAGHAGVLDFSMNAPDSQAAPAWKELQAEAEAAGTRLDQWLAAALAPALSRSRVQALIRGGAVSLDGET